jgi:hypothetical protein
MITGAGFHIIIHRGHRSLPVRWAPIQALLACGREGLMIRGLDPALFAAVFLISTFIAAA